MEEDQEKIDAGSEKDNLKNLLINNPQEESNHEASASNEDAIPTQEVSEKKNEDSKVEKTKIAAPVPRKRREKSKKKLPEPSQTGPKSPSMEKKDKPRTPTPPRSSPEPSCAICLEQLTNKSFTNSCFHMFCFTCLVEWSKVKPECPLCKQSFTSIVHNVRSFQEYDQYHINSRCRTPDSLWSSVQRFRYRTTLTADRLLSRATSHSVDPNIVNEIASHRLRYAPHSVHMRMYSPPQSTGHMPSVFRRRVYEEDLWVHPPEGNRIRLANPEFFQRNIACTHRLLPWLNRELLVVMPHNEGEVGFMIDLIMSLILKYNIKSQEFFTHIEPYTGPRTSHFIHEFYNFAISPYEMEAYDYHAQYDVDLMFSNANESSPDSDVIPLLNVEPPGNLCYRKFKRNKQKLKAERLRRLAQIRLEKLVLKRNSQNMWETVVPYSLTFPDISNSNACIPGPSTSRNPLNFDSTRPNLENRDRSSCMDDDEVEVVQVLKPRSERTPEIVNLSSDDETLATTTEVTSTVKDMSLSVIELSSDATISSADEDEILFLEEKVPAPDKPIDYSLKTSRDQADSPKPKETPSANSSSSNDLESEQYPKKQIGSFIKSAVQVVSNDDSHSSSWSSSAKPKRKKTTSLEGSSTESFSDDSPAQELDSGVKKLKLRSVVAHFSVDRRDEKTDSSHLSSYKKHKEKRKKKKKHKHRRCCIYSSDSS